MSDGVLLVGNPLNKLIINAWIYNIFAVIFNICFQKLTPTAYPTLSLIVIAKIEHPMYASTIDPQKKHSNLSHGTRSNFSTKWNMYATIRIKVTAFPIQ